MYTLNSKCTSKSAAYLSKKRYSIYSKPTFQIPSKFTNLFFLFLGEHVSDLVLWQLPTLQRSQARGDFGHGERPCQFKDGTWKNGDSWIFAAL